MEETKFAHLTNEQLKELTQLEEKLGVTLIAYDPSQTNQQFEISDDLTSL